MNLESLQRRLLASWAIVGVLGVLCLVLAVLQYRWLGELSRAERNRMQEGLQSSLQRLARDSNAEMSAALAALRPTDEEIAELGRESAHAARWAEWRENGTLAGLFKRIAIAVPEGEGLALLLLDQAAGAFQPAEWPASWLGMRDGLLRLRQRRGGPPLDANSALIEVPRFPGAPGEPRGGRGAGEVEWLVVELDLAYVRSTYLPALLARHVGTGMPLYARVWDRFDHSVTIFASGQAPAQADAEAVASVGLLEPNRFDFGRRGGGGGRGRKGGDFLNGPPRQQGAGADVARGRWQLDARFADGSLDAIVARIRWRNLAISAGILALMLLAAVLLVRFSRQQQTLAELQMNFVAGVSHELRTPLTVIRTAAYNLRGRVAANPAQVERYGALIQDESEKLTALVEQVLRFSSSRAGHAVGKRVPLAIEGVIEEGLHSRRLTAAESRIVIEKNLEDRLPLVLGDELALKHAIQNLLDNAVKYGTENSDWIGVSARKVTGTEGDTVEVRIADRGPGIPAEEQGEIFNPFFRGRRAQEDQIHGTGLGLNLVKKIVEAHDGEIRVESEPGRGTEFIIRIPAAPAELQDEFAHTSG